VATGDADNMFNPYIADLKGTAVQYSMYSDCTGRRRQ